MFLTTNHVSTSNKKLEVVIRKTVTTNYMRRNTYKIYKTCNNDCLVRS